MLENRGEVMKKFLICILTIFTAINTSLVINTYAEEIPNVKAYYSMDWHTKTEIEAKNSFEHLPIASMCKIMTLNLCFDEIEAGKMNLSLKDVDGEALVVSNFTLNACMILLLQKFQ